MERFKTRTGENMISCKVFVVVMWARGGGGHGMRYD